MQIPRAPQALQAPAQTASMAVQAEHQSYSRTESTTVSFKTGGTEGAGETSLALLVQMLQILLMMRMLVEMTGALLGADHPAVKAMSQSIQSALNGVKSRLSKQGWGGAEHMSLHMQTTVQESLSRSLVQGGFAAAGASVGAVALSEEAGGASQGRQSLAPKRSAIDERW